tara:strand:- start:8161 stop:8547 length:387 start_codon:yes stop_codon:yes gene_type:complete
MKKILIIAVAFLFTGCASEEKREEKREETREEKRMAQERTEGFCVVLFENSNFECWDAKYSKKECEELSLRFSNSIYRSDYMLHTDERWKNCEDFCLYSTMGASNELVGAGYSPLTREEKDEMCVVNK